MLVRDANLVGLPCLADASHQRHDDLEGERHRRQDGRGAGQNRLRSLNLPVADRGNVVFDERSVQGDLTTDVRARFSDDPAELVVAESRDLPDRMAELGRPP